MKQYRYIIPLIIIFTIETNIFSQDKIMWGGGISLLVPDNSFGHIANTYTNHEFGFATVANTGFNINAGTLWFFNPQLSLQSELAYSYFPKDKKTWNQERYGDISVNYQMVNLTAQGNYYFSEQEIRPYLGAVFGLYYLRNMLDFNSKYVGTDNDASVSYISNTIHAGYGLEGGVLIELSKHAYLEIGIRFTTIPDIESEYIPEDDVTLNPHGKQNHWGLSAKIFFNK